MDSLLGSSGYVDHVVQRIVEHELDRCSHSAKASIVNKMVRGALNPLLRKAQLRKVRPYVPKHLPSTTTCCAAYR
eukprot:3228255-Prorocentrum_lima.AAC.1